MTDGFLATCRRTYMKKSFFLFWFALCTAYTKGTVKSKLNQNLSKTSADKEDNIQQLIFYYIAYFAV